MGYLAAIVILGLLLRIVRDKSKIKNYEETARVRERLYASDRAELSKAAAAQLSIVKNIRLELEDQKQQTHDLQAANMQMRCDLSLSNDHYTELLNKYYKLKNSLTKKKRRTKVKKK